MRKTRTLRRPKDDLTDEQVRRVIAQSMVEAGFDPAILHAFRKTGEYVCADNVARLSKTKLAAWNAAVVEYDEAIQDFLR